MEDSVRYSFCKIINKHGHEIRNEPGRIRGILKDFCFGDDSKIKIKMILHLLDLNIADEIIDKSKTISWFLLKRMLFTKIISENPFPADMLNWGLETIAIAFGIVNEENHNPIEHKEEPSVMTDQQKVEIYKNFWESVSRTTLPSNSKFKELQSLQKKLGISEEKALDIQYPRLLVFYDSEVNSLMPITLSNNEIFEKLSLIREKYPVKTEDAEKIETPFLLKFYKMELSEINPSKFSKIQIFEHIIKVKNKYNITLDISKNVEADFLLKCYDREINMISPRILSGSKLFEARHILKEKYNITMEKSLEIDRAFLDRNYELDISWLAASNLQDTELFERLMEFKNKYDIKENYSKIIETKYFGRFITISRDEKECREFEYKALNEFDKQSIVNISKNAFFSCRNKIPEDKISKASASYYKTEQTDEKILFLYDNTLFGAASKGFIITDRRFCQYNTEPVYIKDITYVEKEKDIIIIKTQYSKIAIECEYIKDISLFHKFLKDIFKTYIDMFNLRCQKYEDLWIKLKNEKNEYPETDFLKSAYEIQFKYNLSDETVNSLQKPFLMYYYEKIWKENDINGSPAKIKRLKDLEMNWKISSDEAMKIKFPFLKKYFFNDLNNIFLTDDFEVDSVKKIINEAEKYELPILLIKEFMAEFIFDYLLKIVKNDNMSESEKKIFLNIFGFAHNKNNVFNAKYIEKVIGFLSINTTPPENVLNNVSIISSLLSVQETEFKRIVKSRREELYLAAAQKIKSKGLSEHDIIKELKNIKLKIEIPDFSAKKIELQCFGKFLTINHDQLKIEEFTELSCNKFNDIFNYREYLWCSKSKIGLPGYEKARAEKYFKKFLDESDENQIIFLHYFSNWAGTLKSMFIINSKLFVQLGQSPIYIDQIVNVIFENNEIYICDANSKNKVDSSNFNKREKLFDFLNSIFTEIIDINKSKISKFKNELEKVCSSGIPGDTEIKNLKVFAERNEVPSPIVKSLQTAELNKIYKNLWDCKTSSKIPSHDELYELEVQKRLYLISDNDAQNIENPLQSLKSFWERLSSTVDISQSDIENFDAAKKFLKVSDEDALKLYSTLDYFMKTWNNFNKDGYPTKTQLKYIDCIQYYLKIPEHETDGAKAVLFEKLYAEELQKIAAADSYDERMLFNILIGLKLKYLISWKTSRKLEELYFKKLITAPKRYKQKTYFKKYVCNKLISLKDDPFKNNCLFNSCAGIPHSKIDQAAISYFKKIDNDEEPIILYDNTLLGTGQKGFIITEKRLYQNECKPISLKEITGYEIEKDTFYLKLLSIKFKVDTHYISDKNIFGKFIMDIVENSLIFFDFKEIKIDDMKKLIKDDDFNSISSILSEQLYDMELKDSEGAGLLFPAVDRGNANMVKLLIEYGADVRGINNNGVSILMTAVLTGNKEIVKLLIENNTNIFSTDKNGKTAYDYAIINKYEHLYHLLR